MRLTGAILVVTMSLGMSGCWSFKKKAPKPLPPLSSPSITPPTPQVDLPPEATTPIQIEPPPHPPEATVIRPDIQLPERKPPKAEAEPKPTARRPAPAQAPPPAVTVPEAAPETTPAPVPQLGELISDERRGEMQNEIDQSLARARSTLTIAAQRSLSRRQNETATRVRTFIRQAEEAKVRDISTALQLARRADLLAQDLAGALR